MKSDGWKIRLCLYRGCDERQTVSAISSGKQKINFHADKQQHAENGSRYCQINVREIIQMFNQKPIKDVRQRIKKRMYIRRRDVNFQPVVHKRKTVIIMIMQQIVVNFKSQQQT